MYRLSLLDTACHKGAYYNRAQEDGYKQTEQAFATHLTPVLTKHQIDQVQNFEEEEEREEEVPASESASVGGEGHKPGGKKPAVTEGVTAAGNWPWQNHGHDTHGLVPCISL